MNMTFSYNEDHVYGCDESTQSIICWDSRTGRLVKKFKGHEKVVCRIVASPVEDAFISCSDDHRARFWYPAPNFQ
jgi:cleavage stimulation factor subunit 1